MSTQPILLCASDLDGTLLSSQHLLTPFTKETIYRIEKQRGVPFVLATGRHHRSVRAIRESLVDYFTEKEKECENASDAAPPGFYLVSSNGARIHDGRGNLIFEQNLAPDVVRALYVEFGLPYTRKRYAGPPGTASPPMPTTPVTYNAAIGEFVRVRVNEQGEPLFPVDGSSGADIFDGDDDEDDPIHANDEEPDDVVSTSAYTTDEWHITASFLPNEEMKKKFGFVPSCENFDIHDPANKGKSAFDTFPTEGVGKVCFRCSNKNILAYFERAIKARFPGRVSVALSSNYCLDVMAAGVSKASALEEVASMLNRKNNAQGENVITLDKVIAFGDSMNDKLMLKSVGHGCVMENGQPRLKKELPQCEVIGHHDDEAVAKRLLQAFGL